MLCSAATTLSSSACTKKDGGVLSVTCFSASVPWSALELSQLSKNKRCLLGVKILSQAIKQLREFVLIGPIQSRGAIRFTLMPENSFQRSAPHGNSHALQHVVIRMRVCPLVINARLPEPDRCPPNRTRDQSDRPRWILIGQNDAKRSPRPNACDFLVKMYGISREDPFVLAIQCQDTGGVRACPHPRRLPVQPYLTGP